MGGYLPVFVAELLQKECAYQGKTLDVAHIWPVQCKTAEYVGKSFALLLVIVEDA